jgi:flagellar M-ring protein FliF
MGALVSNNALPRNISEIMSKAVDSTSSNPFISKEERQNRMKVAKEDLLGMIISKMPGMEYGTVILDFDTASTLKREKIFAATATAKLQGSAQLDEDTVNSIRQLVRGAVAGMKPEDVTVIDQNGHAWPGTPEGGGGAIADQYTQLRRANEKDLNEKIQRTLSYIPGITVATTIKLDSSKSTRTIETKYDKVLPIKEFEAKSKSMTENAGMGGPTGFTVQQPNTGLDLNKKTSGGSKSDENTTKTETTSIAAGSQTDLVKVGLTPVMAKASIGIPSSYIKHLWEIDNPKDTKGPDAAALQPIGAKIAAEVKKTVENLLPSTQNPADATDLVQVTIFQEVPAAVPPETSIAKTAMFWLGDYWSLAGMIVLAAVSLLMLKTLVKSAPPAFSMQGGLRLAKTEAEDAAESSGDKKATPANARRFTTGPSLRDEISTLVQEDPDTAANILKTWIGHPIGNRT